MLGIVNYGAYLVSCVLLNITPGSDTIYILSKSATGGRQKGMISALGICTGILIHTLLASLGLSIILAKSALAFQALKLAGAAYLVWMGVKAILSKESLLAGDAGAVPERRRHIYRQGVLTNVLNPKVALFFLALLPQFVSADNPYGPLPFLLLGLTFVSTSVVWCLFLAYAASFLSRLLNRNPRISSLSNKGAGLIYIALGLKVLAAEQTA